MMRRNMKNLHIEEYPRQTLLSGSYDKVIYAVNTLATNQNNPIGEISSTIELC